MKQISTYTGLFMHFLRMKSETSCLYQSYNALNIFNLIVYVCLNMGAYGYWEFHHTKSTGPI